MSLSDVRNAAVARRAGNEKLAVEMENDEEKKNPNQDPNEGAEGAESDEQ